MKGNRTSDAVAVVLTAAFYLAMLWLIAVALTGCATTVKERVKTVEVKIPVYVQPPEIELPPEPEWETPSANEGDWLEYLRAMTRDLLNAWAHIEELRWLIEVQNEAGRRVEDE